MPISLIGAAIVMYAFGFSLNLLTILAIVLSVGLVVDDAIVGRGERRTPRARRADRGVGRGDCRPRASCVGPIIAMTITLAAVYTPIGVPGRPDGLAVPRVRDHARGGGRRVRRRRGDAVADDELAVRARATARKAADRVRQSRLRRRAPRYAACSTARLQMRWPIVVACAARSRSRRGRCISSSRGGSWRRSRIRVTSACSSRRRPTRR